jgi:hypothetical protein
MTTTQSQFQLYLDFSKENSVLMRMIGGSLLDKSNVLDLVDYLYKQFYDLIAQEQADLLTTEANIKALLNPEKVNLIYDFYEEVINFKSKHNITL